MAVFNVYWASLFIPLRGCTATSGVSLPTTSLVLCDCLSYWHRRGSPRCLLLRVSCVLTSLVPSPVGEFLLTYYVACLVCAGAVGKVSHHNPQAPRCGGPLAEGSPERGRVRRTVCRLEVHDRGRAECVLPYYTNCCDIPYRLFCVVGARRMYLFALLSRAAEPSKYF